MSEKKRKAGRRPKFQSVKELQAKIDAYFAECDKKKAPYTITGLASALDTTRKTLLDYENRNDEFSEAIIRAKARCEEYAERQLFASKQCTGAIFTLKNNFGWQDTQEIRGKHILRLEIVESFDEDGQPEKVTRKEIRTR